MQSVEAEGESIDAAIHNALQLLGVSRERAEIEILNNASRGLFGIGGRKAKVRATLRVQLSATEPTTPGRDNHTTTTEAPKRESRPQSKSRTPRHEPRAISDSDRELAARARDVLQEIVRHVGVEAQVELREEPDGLGLDLTGDTSGVLIGRRGQMLDALEYLINRIVAKDASESARIFVDSQHYRQRRREALEQMARRMGDQARKKRRAVTLNPMSPRDRRIVHLVLQDEPGLTTKSSGTGYYRKLVIIPEGARSPRAER